MGTNIYVETPKGSRHEVPKRLFDTTADATMQSYPYSSTSYSFQNPSRTAAAGPAYEFREDPASKGNVQKFAGLAVGISGMIAEHVLSHPCVVLRRQCQVHPEATWNHLTPFTLLPIIYNIQRNQSITTLWKGISSVFMIKGLTVITESTVSEFTPLPKEVNRHSSLKKLMQHLLLKGISVVIVMPFYAASLIETVQSEIASERPGVLDCLREGLSRVLGWGATPTARLLPLWRLVPLMVVYGVSHYAVASLAQYTVMLSIRTEIMEAKEQQAAAVASLATSSLPSSSSATTHNPATTAATPATQAPMWYEAYHAQLLASFTGRLLADVLLYPMECILHRLLLQGTRTIIDNVNSGTDVVPVITRYAGPIDCCRSVIVQEGLSGFYRGFGAVLLQYAMHGAILKITQVILQKVGPPAEEDKMMADILRQRQLMNEQHLAHKQQLQHSAPPSTTAASQPHHRPTSATLRDPRVQQLSSSDF